MIETNLAAKWAASQSLKHLAPLYIHQSRKFLAAWMFPSHFSPVSTLKVLCLLTHQRDKFVNTRHPWFRTRRFENLLLLRPSSCKPDMAPRETQVGINEYYPNEVVASDPWVWYVPRRLRWIAIWLLRVWCYTSQFWDLDPQGSNFYLSLQDRRWRPRTRKVHGKVLGETWARTGFSTSVPLVTDGAICQPDIHPWKLQRKPRYSWNGQ